MERQLLDAGEFSGDLEIKLLKSESSDSDDSNNSKQLSVVEPRELCPEEEQLLARRLMVEPDSKVQPIFSVTFSVRESGRPGRPDPRTGLRR